MLSRNVHHGLMYIKVSAIACKYTQEALVSLLNRTGSVNRQTSGCIKNNLNHHPDDANTWGGQAFRLYRYLQVPLACAESEFIVILYRQRWPLLVVLMV